MSNRVVITGVGLCTNLGSTQREVEKNLFNGNTNFVYDSYLDATIGKINEDVNFSLDSFDKNITDRYSRIAWSAYKNLKDDSKLTPEGIFLGVAHGGTYSLEKAVIDSQKNSRVNPNTVVCTMHNNASNFIALKEFISGPALTFSSACASSTIAIGEAFLKIKDGYYNSLVAGGAESNFTKTFIESWKSIRALAAGNENVNELCKPFSADRAGIVISEGSAVYMLENLKHALDRKAKIYAEITGFSVSTGSDSMTKPSIKGQTSAIVNSLKYVEFEKNFYVNAHGTGTTVGDMLELLSLKEAFGKKIQDVPISSTKSIHGHCMGASGAIELFSCLSVLKNNKIIPNFYLNNPDPSIPKDIFLPTSSVKMNVDYCLNNSFAFGGTNAVLVLKRYNS